MGIFRLYVKIAEHLHANPSDICKKSLEELCTCYTPYAYVGNRRSLRAFLEENLKNLPLSSLPFHLQNAPTSEMVNWWIGGKQNLTDSGAFPDFVLAWQGTQTLGDGALLELKDSASNTISSFNSTLPSAKKSISSLSDIVSKTVRRVDNGPDERDCFYMVRTMRNNCDQVRLSIVHGTFFETIPKRKMLKSLWQEVLNQAKVPLDLQEKLYEYLANLEQEDIAKTREIPGASIKPRLRLMAEVHSDGNPHTYPEVLPASFNLIIKPPDTGDAVEWLWIEFKKEGIDLEKTSYGFQYKHYISFKLFSINHKRNGTHIGLRYSCKDVS